MGLPGAACRWAASMYAGIFIKLQNTTENISDMVGDGGDKFTFIGDIKDTLSDLVINKAIPVLEPIGIAIALFFFILSLITMFQQERLTIEMFIKQFLSIAIAFVFIMISPTIYQYVLAFGEALGEASADVFTLSNTAGDWFGGITVGDVTDNGTAKVTTLDTAYKMSDGAKSKVKSFTGSENSLASYFDGVLTITDDTTLGDIINEIEKEAEEAVTGKNYTTTTGSLRYVSYRDDGTTYTNTSNVEHDERVVLQLAFNLIFHNMLETNGGDETWLTILMSGISTALPLYICSFVLFVVAAVISITRLIELSVRGAFLPIAFGTLAEDGLRGPGGRYLKKFIAICAQVAVLVMIAGITGSICGAVASTCLSTMMDGDMINLGTSALLIIGAYVASMSVMFKSIGLINDVFGA